MSFLPGGFPLWRALALIGLATGGYFLHRHFEVAGLGQLSLQRRSIESSDVGDHAYAGFLPTAAASVFPSELFSSGVTATLASAPARRAAAPDDEPMPENLRIASWALGGFSPQKIRDPEVMAIFTSVVQRFDIVALQQVRPSERDALPSLVRQLNRGGRAYDYLAGGVHRSSVADDVGEQLVFLFDTTRVVTDRTQLYSVADPDNRLTYKPLVAWFRAAEVDPQRAWTFSLVNTRIELSRARQEVYELPAVISAVGADGRGEDDVIVAGLFQADHIYLGATLGEQKYTLAIKNKTTDIFARHQSSNLITDRRATTEALGRSGVLDFLRFYNLSLAQAEQVSPHLPVYAEFSPWEGGHR